MQLKLPTSGFFKFCQFVQNVLSQGEEEPRQKSGIQSETENKIMESLMSILSVFQKILIKEIDRRPIK